MNPSERNIDEDRTVALDGVTAVSEQAESGRQKAEEETLPIRAARLPSEDATAVLGDDELVLGRYRLLRRIGSGGFGVVWLALDERLERHVAVKVVPRVERGKPRAQREALSAARLNHPGIVALYEAGQDDESRYLVSELVRGRTMSELLAEGALSDRDVARIGTALCDALGHAHAQGVVHRDVKPANVMIPERPVAGGAVAKLMDFGIAQLAGAEALTRTGDVIGTIAYMAPEQAEGRRVGPAADVYSLGVVLYEALAGEHPVRRAGAAATARRIGTVLPSLARKRRDLPLELCDAIDRAVRPRPPDRGELADLRSALAAALPGLPDEGRVLAGSPVEGLVAPALPRYATRLAAGLGAGALAWTAWASLGPDPPYEAAMLAALTAVVVALLPRVGWLAAATAIIGWLSLAPDARPGSALLVAAGAVACPVLLPRNGRGWSLPGAAPALGALGLAGAYPALAGQARGWWQRASLGALGFWWLLLAEPLTRSTLFFGRSDGTGPRAAWEGSASDAAGDALVPLLSSGALAGAALFAGFAVVLPWLVRGRWLAADVVAATAWAAGLAACGGALGEAIAPAVAHPDPRGVVAGAALAGVVAVAAARARLDTRLIEGHVA